MRNRLFRGDVRLLLSIILLFLCGAVCVLSASLYRSGQLFNDPLFLFKRHLLWALLGLVVAVPVYKTNLSLIEKFMPWLLLFNLVLLILTFIDGIGVSYLGARRWISIGPFTFQPSELVKISIVLYMAVVLERKKQNIFEPWNSFIPPLIVVALFVALIYLQNDFSTAMLMILVAMIMFFIGQVPLRYFLVLAISTLPIVFTLLFSRPHRLERIIAYLIPSRDPQGSGFQVLAAESAIRRGGLWGVGIGQGTTKNGALPEAHSDFVFATIVEEYGLFGALIVIFLFMNFLIQGIRISSKIKSDSYAYLGYGIAVIVSLQALVNIAVACHILPPTGITLPFFSTGGSSLIITIIMCALLLNVSAHSSVRGEQDNTRLYSVQQPSHIMQRSINK